MAPIVIHCIPSRLRSTPEQPQQGQPTHMCAGSLALRMEQLKERRTTSNTMSSRKTASKRDQINSKKVPAPGVWIVTGTQICALVYYSL